MIDGRNLNTEQMKAALKHLSETSGKAASDIEQAINSGNWEDFVRKNMNPTQAKTLRCFWRTVRPRISCLPRRRHRLCWKSS